MKASLGSLAVALGFAAAVTGAVLAGVAARRRDPRMTRTARTFVWIVLAAAVAAVAVMEWALLSHDFSLRYVAENGSRETPTLFTVASLWAALAGSILLWTLILSIHLAFAAFRWRRHSQDPLIGWATSVAFVAAAFFFGLMLGPANPFRSVIGAVPSDGTGPNPLLQNHPMMAFHPPLLYLGYVGFTIPFALAIAALISGRVGEQWLRLTRGATLIAWSCLTGGIVLGAWWSYEVLGWGGYWAWDPVENAALIPWFTATAYLHSVIVQERRGMLRVWNLSLLIATYCLTILGTFLTRSGVVNSVHAFTQSAVGPTLIAYLAAVAVIGLALLAWRGDRLHAPGRIDSPLSREAAFLGNNLVLTGLAVVVVTGTVFPLLAEGLWGQQLSVGEPYFNRLTGPLGLTLLLLMAVAPLLPYRAADPTQLRRRLLGPTAAGTATVVVVVAAGVRGVLPVLAFGLAATTVWSILSVVASAVHSRARTSGEHLVRAAAHTVATNRRRYGGLLVHLGVVVLAVGLTASHNYSSHREVDLARGQSATVGGYTVTYLDTVDHNAGNKLTKSARIRVVHHGDDLGIYTPSLSIFRGATTAIGTPSVHPGLTRDVYLTLTSSPDDRGRVTLGVFINPLVTWLWLGGMIMVAGAVVAGWPRRRGRPRREPGDTVSVEANELGRPLTSVSA
jgi:cytochrome c-type biogenesis protein CcmF